MADPKKSLALLILEHAKKKGMAAPDMADGDEGSDAEEESEPGVESAMEDFMTALKADDVKGAVAAYKSLCELGMS